MARAKARLVAIRDQNSRPRRLAAALVGHFAMGVALGLGMALILTLDARFGVRELVLRSADPQSAALLFVGTFAAMFGIGATLTGFVLLAMERDRQD
jgi:hypothetical protein